MYYIPQNSLPYYWNYGQDYRQQLTSQHILQNPNQYNGLIIKDALPSDKRLYLIEKGTRRLIHSPSVYHALFRDTKTQEVLNIDFIPLGNPIVEGSHLIKSNNESNPNLYWYDKENGHSWFKRRIANPNVYEKYHFTFNVTPYPQSIIDGLPDGSVVN
ncbi:hypothetical protein COE01_21610 [Bacillus thuringiensis]|uniref:hypothetical protein n=1 Tax=Bacillus cereus group TaxID=86661 RepID=UPI00027A8F1E|nr:MULTISPECIES: hypothetical protein [Bacillus cereus group]MDA2236425.1 hypothetical protein [Bacillus cereus]EJS46383.1 hypothetical protein ICE_05209 [Bacillus cereus BAG1X1-2]PGW77702.1 hypothetical protein COE01_21610 [Bacillus thuringiensis]HDR4868743.1 hypothetical protein [Bacillus cereus]HDR4880261.1 hypothetical protein [Bacillus cereus]